jgi:MATE family multidrug resistance protein
VRGSAEKFLPYASIYVGLSFAAFQLDGVFIGATGTRAMRNASMASCLVFLATSSFAIPLGGNTGLWLTFIIYVVVRATALGAHYSALRRSSTEPDTPQSLV